MTFDDDLNACASIVERGDPDRFLATMATPVSARAVLFPIYAFNVEVARAPWVTAEPIVAEMRLQWWWDALEEIATNKPVRRHEVTIPLAHVLRRQEALDLQSLVDMRRQDANRIDPEDWSALRAYLTGTGGVLLWVAARALGSEDEDRALAIGRAQALANYLLAVPALAAAGRKPLPTSDGLQAEIKDTLHAVSSAPPARSKPQRIAELAGWRAVRILKRAQANPDRVSGGELAEPEALRRASLFFGSLRI